MHPTGQYLGCEPSGSLIPTSFMGGLGALANIGAGLASPGMAGGNPLASAAGLMGGMMGGPSAPAASMGGIPGSANPFPGPAELIPNPMPQMGAAEPAEVATNQLGVGVAAAAVLGVLLGCVLFRRGGQPADGDSDDDLDSSDDSK